MILPATCVGYCASVPVPVPVASAAVAFDVPVPVAGDGADDVLVPVACAACACASFTLCAATRSGWGGCLYIPDRTPNNNEATRCSSLTCITDTCYA
jgi:hypothetical protein